MSPKQAILTILLAVAISILFTLLIIDTDRLNKANSKKTEELMEQLKTKNVLSDKPIIGTVYEVEVKGHLLWIRNAGHRGGMMHAPTCPCKQVKD